MLSRVVNLPTIGIVIGVALAIVGRAITNEREIKERSKKILPKIKQRKSDNFRMSNREMNNWIEPYLFRILGPH